MSFPSICTRTGDLGLTSLWSGERVPKTDPRIRAVGALDLALASLGKSSTLVDPTDPTGEKLVSLFRDIHRRCIHLMGEVACSAEKRDRFRQEKQPISADDVTELEAAIDGLRQELSQRFDREFKWKLYGEGGPLAAEFYVTRGLFREAEIRLWQCVEKGFEQSEATKAYVNRLSDLLFVVAVYFEAPDSEDR